MKNMTMKKMRNKKSCKAVLICAVLCLLLSFAKGFAAQAETLPEGSTKDALSIAANKAVDVPAVSLFKPVNPPASIYSEYKAASTPSSVTTGSSVDSDLYFTIEFDSNGGEYVTTIRDIIPHSRCTVPSTTREGYWFRGWFQDKNFKTPFLSGDYVSKSMVLYAKWQPKENSKKDTMSWGNITDGKYTTHISVDLTGQNYDHTISLTAIAIDPKVIQKAANSMSVEPERYMGVNLEINGLVYDSQKPVPVTLFLPPEFELKDTGIYLSPNRSTIMAQMPHTVATTTSFTFRVPNGSSVSTKFVSGTSITFNAYQDGTYIILDKNTEAETTEQLKPYIEVKYKKTQIAVKRELKMWVKLYNFPEDELKDYEVVWKSKNPKRASIDQKGWVKGLKKGKVTIQCKVITKKNTYFKKAKLEILP